MHQVSVENSSFHKNCFKCVHGGCRLSLSNYQALESKLYCKPHYKQLFAAKGNYSELQKLPAPGTAVAKKDAAPAGETAPQVAAVPAPVVEDAQKVEEVKAE